MIWALTLVTLAALVCTVITAIGVYREMKDFDAIMKDFDAMWQSLYKDKSDE